MQKWGVGLLNLYPSLQGSSQGAPKVNSRYSIKHESTNINTHLTAESNSVIFWTVRTYEKLNELSYHLTINPKLPVALHRGRTSTHLPRAPLTASSAEPLSDEEASLPPSLNRSDAALATSAPLPSRPGPGRRRRGGGRSGRGSWPGDTCPPGRVSRRMTARCAGRPQ